MDLVDFHVVFVIVVVVVMMNDHNDDDSTVHNHYRYPYPYPTYFPPCNLLMMTIVWKKNTGLIFWMMEQRDVDRYWKENY